VQEAVLDDGLSGRDLRITSQTGSGKTIAIGFAVRDLLDDLTAQGGGPARPRVLVLAPTRELAKQVAEELTWLYAPLRVRSRPSPAGPATSTRSAPWRRILRCSWPPPGAFATPSSEGRSTSSALAAIVLDEADSMLDLGFREDLEAILAKLPAERRSHLVSATFSRDVVALADRFQKDPVHVEGTRLGEANSDIAHVVHLVAPAQRVDALINLLLSDEDAKSLVFVRTRADWRASPASSRRRASWSARCRARWSSPNAIGRSPRSGKAGSRPSWRRTWPARGIDVRDIARVIQVEPPTDVETYTHRSGRTGRAGKQGLSVLFVAPPHYPAIARGLARAKIAHRVEPIPRPDAIQRAREEKLVAWLAREGRRRDHRSARALHRRAHREQRRRGERDSRGSSRRPGCTGRRRRATCVSFRRRGRNSVRAVRGIRALEVRARCTPRATRGTGKRRAAPATTRRRATTVRREAMGLLRGPTARPRGPRPNDDRGAPGGGPEWVTFPRTWGSLHGADARRLLAVACRRGDIRGSGRGRHPGRGRLFAARRVAKRWPTASRRRRLDPTRAIPACASRETRAVRAVDEQPPRRARPPPPPPVQPRHASAPRNGPPAQRSEKPRPGAPGSGRQVRAPEATSRRRWRVARPPPRQALTPTPPARR